jgi:hypothetical protein
MNVQYAYIVYLRHEGFSYRLNSVIIDSKLARKNSVWEKTDITAMDLRFASTGAHPSRLRVISSLVVDGHRQIYVEILVSFD